MVKLRHQHAWWVSALASSLLRTLGATTRVRVLGDTLDYRRCIFSMWHGDMLLFAHRHRNRGVRTLVSNNRDGEIIARTVTRLGYGTVRGSSTRGGVRAIRDFFRDGTGVGWLVTPDGPRGPRHGAKEGIIHLAAASGWPILPCGAAASRAWRFGSWDRMELAKPFSRMVHVFGEPMTVDPELDKDGRASACRDLEDRMAAAATRAAGELRAWIGT